jgi:hypothetical protein
VVGLRRFEQAGLVVSGLDARGDHQPIPGVDRRDREDELGKLFRREGST